MTKKGYFDLLRQEQMHIVLDEFQGTFEIVSQIQAYNREKPKLWSNMMCMT